MSSLKAAIRPTLRDVRHHPLRSLAAILLIALPATYAAFLIGYNASEQQFYSISSKETSAQFYGGECTQSVDGFAYRCTNGAHRGVADPNNDSNGESNDTSTSAESESNQIPAPQPPIATTSQDRIAQVLGNDFAVTMFVTIPVTLHSDTDTGQGPGHDPVSSIITQLPGAHLLPGSPDVGPGEVVLSELAAKQLKVRVGDTVRATDVGKPHDDAAALTASDAASPAFANVSDVTLTVKSVIPNNVMSSNYVIAPTFISETNVPNDSHVTWVLGGKDDVSWDDVKALNKAGLVVSSLKFRSNPQLVPVADRYPEFPHSDGNSDSDSYTSNSVIARITSILFELTFYLVMSCLMLATISPVFAVATSRQTKVYALMRSQGAYRRHIRWAVMAYGTVAGVVGSIIGIVVGTILSWAYWKVTQPGWPFITDSAMLAMGFVVAVVGATFSAVIPAVIAAKGEIMAGVAGMQPDRIRRWRRWMWTGPVLLVLLVGCLLVEWLWHPMGQFMDRGGDLGTVYDLITAVVILLLLVVTLGGVFTSVIVLVFWAGMIRKPLGAKLAGRQVRRQALRSGAIVAALIGTVFFVTIIDLSTINTAHQNQRFTSDVYSPAAVEISGSMFASSDDDAGNASYADVVAQASSERSRDVMGLVAARLGQTAEFPVVKNSSDVQLSLADGCQGSWESETYTYRGKNADTDPEAAKHCRYLRMESHNPYFAPMAANFDVLVGGPELLQMFNLTDEQRAAATQVLNDGGVVGPSTLVTETGRRTIHMEKRGAVVSEKQQPKVTVAELPVTAALPEQMHGWLMSPQAAEQLGVPLMFSRYVVITEQPGTEKDQKELAEQVRNYDEHYSINVLKLSMYRYDPIYVWVVFVGIMLILGLALMVAAPQLRAQNEQLYALGASTNLVRQIGGYYGAITAALGIWPALILGHIVAFLQTDFNKLDVNGEVLQLGSVSTFGVDWYAIVVLGVLVPILAATMGYFSTRSNQMLSYRQD